MTVLFGEEGRTGQKFKAYIYQDSLNNLQHNTKSVLMTQHTTSP